MTKSSIAPSPHYVALEACAFCDSKNFEVVMDFGKQALAGGFLTQEQIAGEQSYPMRLVFCKDCYAVQIADIIDPDVLFSNYFYFSSAIQSLREHFVDYATEITTRFMDTSKPCSVLEIGCNDGVLLKPLADMGFAKAIGVDPASNVIKRIEHPNITLVNDFFSSELAESLKKKHGAVQCVCANNVYAHIPSINDVTKGIHTILDDDGVFVFEVHYLGKILQGLQYDMIYHEHLYYYSLIALQNHFKRHGMVVFDVKPIPIHAGSMRYYVCKENSSHASNISFRVKTLEKEELAKAYDNASMYKHFAADIAQRRDKLMALLRDLKKKGKTIAGYGASGRANTILQYCGIDSSILDYMIDDAPAKAGFYTPGSHLRIYPNTVLSENPPDYLLVLAWGYFNEIAEKCRDYMEQGGKLITPLPDIRITYVPTRGEEIYE